MSSEEYPMEKWKPVIGFEGLYEISNLGNCRRIARGKKLTADKAELAKKLLAEGGTLHGVGAKVGVSFGTILQIRKGRTWNGNTKFRVLKGEIGRDFYIYFWLSANGKPKRFSAHRILWESFNGPIPYRLQINHKNLNRSDNRIENLELVTASENISHALEIYRKEGKCHNDGGRYYEKKISRKA